MPLWTDQTPPVLYPNAVATPAGWADPVTGELYVTVSGLSTFKGTAAELTQVRLLTEIDQITTSQVLPPKGYAAGEVMVLEALFSEPVTWTGQDPQIIGNLNGTDATFAYFQDTTDVLKHTADKVMSVAISNPGSHYAVGDQLVFTGGGGTLVQDNPQPPGTEDYYYNLPGIAKGYVSAVDGSGAITAITLTSNGSGYTGVPTIMVDSGHVYSVTASGGTLYVNGDTLTFTTAGSTKSATGYIVTNSDGSLNRAVVTSGGVGYNSVPTVGKTSLYGSGGTLTAVSSYGSGASLTAVLGTPANGKGTNRILFGYTVASDLQAASNQITFTSPIGSSGTTVWSTVDSSRDVAAVAAAALPVVTSETGITSYTVGGTNTGYTAVPTVNITGDGVGASAQALLQMSGVAVGTAGAGYGVAPVVSQTTNNPGSTAATITPVLATTGKVVDVTSIVAGSGYLSSDYITAAGDATFKANLTVNGTGGITGITITNTGSGGLSGTPALSIFTSVGGAGGTGTLGHLTSVLGFAIASYTVSGTNSGYLGVPNLNVAAPAATVHSTGATLTQGTATASLNVGAVVPITTGSGYTQAHTTAAFSVGNATVAPVVAAGGEITSFVMTNKGSEYWIAPTVSITGDGSGAAATAILDDRGHVVGVSTNGYVSGITVSGSSTAPYLYIDGEPLAIAGGATGHIHVVNTTTTNPLNGFETITAQTVTAVVDTPGSGYIQPPTVSYSLPGKGTGLTFTAAITGESAGAGYTATLPSISAWNSGTAYTVGEYVLAANGVTYYAVQGSTGVEPPNSAYWWVSSITSPIYSAATVTFTSVGDVPTITFNNTQYVSSVTVSGPGTGYENGTALVFIATTAATTLSANITTSSVTSCSVTSGAGIDNGDYIKIDTEVMLVTAGGGTSTLTITRGALGTTAATHTSTTDVFDGNIAGTVVVNSAGSITGTVITDSGSYTAAPTVLVSTPPTWLSSVTYSLGNIVYYNGTSQRYVSLQNGNLNQTPGSAPLYWTVLLDQTLTAVMGSKIVGASYVDGTAPSITAAVITQDRFGDAITQVAYHTGDYFTVTLTCSKPVFVTPRQSNKEGLRYPYVELTIGAGSAVRAYYFNGSGTETLRFAYQILATDSCVASVTPGTGFFVDSPVTLSWHETGIFDAPGNELVYAFTPPDTSAVSTNQG